jgi:hypothetical protein
MAINLAIRILGGEGSNRLHQVLRTERGLTYGAQANMDALKVSGDFEAETNTRSEATGEVLRLIVDEFWRLQRERVGERELADAKAYMTGSFPLTIETPDAIALQVVNVVFYGLPLEQLQTFRDRVNAVTVDDIQRVARDFLRPDRLSVVLVGNAAAFTPQLQAVGFGTYETVELGDLDLMAASLKKGPIRAAPQRHELVQDSRGGASSTPTTADGAVSARTAVAFRRGRPWSAPAYTPVQAASRPPAAQGNEEIEKAKALVAKAIEAKGGLEKLRGVKTIVVKQTITNPSAPRDKTIERTTYIEYPDRFRIEASSAAGPNVQAFDGTNGWAKDERGVHPMPDALARDARTAMRRDPLVLLIAASTGAMAPRILPDVKDARGRMYHALEVSAPDFDPVVLLIDPETSHVAKMTFVAEGPGRPLIEDEFSDYRPVDGVQIAFQATRRNGSQAIERTIGDAKINTPIDPSLFKRPS